MLKPKRYYLGKFFFLLQKRFPRLYLFLNKNFIFSILINSWIRYYDNYTEVKVVKPKGKAKLIEPTIVKE